MRLMVAENFKECLKKDLKWAKEKERNETKKPIFMDHYKEIIKMTGNDLTINETVILCWLDLLRRPSSVRGIPIMLPSILATMKVQLNDDSLFDFYDVWCVYLKYKDNLFTKSEQNIIEKYREVLRFCYY